MSPYNGEGIENKTLPLELLINNSIDKTDFKSKVLHISNFSYPNNWDLEELKNELRIISPWEDDYDKFQENIVLQVTVAGADEISDIISRNLNFNKENLTEFRFLGSNETHFSKKPAQQIMYTYFDNNCECYLEVMSIYTLIGRNSYVTTFFSEPNKFASYIPLVDKVIDSIIIETTYKLNKSGLPLNGSPVDLAVNPVTNKLYVAIPESKQIQVIDGSTDRIIRNISIGAYPNAIALNPVLNRVYVASPETDIIYVIDGVTNEIVNKIQAGRLVGDVSVDTNEFFSYASLVFVANQGNNSISILDDVKGRVMANIKTGNSPYSIGIDSINNRAYVTRQNGIDVIEYSTSLAQRTTNATYYPPIPTSYIPTGIIVNSNTSTAYVTNSDGSTVSVIDTISNSLLYDIEVGLFPYSIAFNPNDKKIYVANAGQSIVSIIDSTIDKNNVNSSIIPVPVDSIPYDVAVNPRTNMIYMANYDSKTISTINGTTNAAVSALTFHVSPPSAGQIECNKKKIPENTYVRIEVDSQCSAISNFGFVFSSWSLGAPSNASNILGSKAFFDSISTTFGSIFGGPKNYTKPILNVTAYGENTANFISLASIVQVASPFLSIGTLILVTLVAVIKPNITRWRKLIIIPTSSSHDGKDNINKDEVKLKNEDDKILSRGEILTIDATVIIGVLIFLTFTEGFEASEQYQINVITASIVFPFAISAIIGVTKTEKFATRLMIAGFINLMISVILIAIMKL